MALPDLAALVGAGIAIVHVRGRISFQLGDAAPCGVGKNSRRHAQIEAKDWRALQYHRQESRDGFNPPCFATPVPVPEQYGDERGHVFIMRVVGC